MNIFRGERTEAGEAIGGEGRRRCFLDGHSSKQGADVFYFLGKVSCKVNSSEGGKGGVRGVMREEDKENSFLGLEAKESIFVILAENSRSTTYMF